MGRWARQQTLPGRGGREIAGAIVGPKLAIGRATSREHGSSIVLGGVRSIHAVKASALVCIRHDLIEGDPEELRSNEPES